jgi:hypothetical protein
MKKNAAIILSGSLFLFIVLTGLTLLPEEYRRTVEAGKAKIVDTEIVLPAGKLIITADAKALCEGIYRYKWDYFKPEISYSEDSEKGYLKIETEDIQEKRNYNTDEPIEWNISINRNIENEMNIKMLAGESDVNLEGSKLRRMQFEMLAGDSKINLRNTSVPVLKLKALAGEVDIDLRGKWTNDLDATIKGGVGELNLILPSDIGIKLEISGGLGEVKAPGFSRNNNEYTNNLYGKTKHSLYFDITGGIGNVNIRTESWDL